MNGLLPGDVLLYNSKGLYGRIIAIKTWHKITHVECYLGLGLSAASRNGQGVNIYALREHDLVKIWRPLVPFDAAKAMCYAAGRKGEPYGWMDLWAFVGFAHDGKGVICSTFVAELQRNQGIDAFNGEPACQIAPFEWLLSSLGVIYEVKDGQISGEGRGVAPGASGGGGSAA